MMRSRMVPMSASAPPSRQLSPARAWPPSEANTRKSWCRKRATPSARNGAIATKRWPSPPSGSVPEGIKHGHSDPVLVRQTARRIHRNPFSDLSLDSVRIGTFPEFTPYRIDDRFDALRAVGPLRHPAGTLFSRFLELHHYASAVTPDVRSVRPKQQYTPKDRVVFMTRW